jgi:hypothetical protein
MTPLLYSIRSFDDDLEIVLELIRCRFLGPRCHGDNEIPYPISNKWLIAMRGLDDRKTHRRFGLDLILHGMKLFPTNCFDHTLALQGNLEGVNKY